MNGCTDFVDGRVDGEQEVSRTWAGGCVGAGGGGACGALNSNDSCFGLVLLLEGDRQMDLLVRY